MQYPFKPLPPELDVTAIDPAGLTLTEEDLLRMYRAMRLARTFETRLAALYRQGRIIGAVYLGTGQESIAAGVASLMEKDDIFNTVSRNLAAWFYRGVEPKHVLARWFGKDVPPSHGRDLGLFLADLPHYGIAPFHNGSMASWIPSGAGFALAFKMKRQPNVYIAFTGDGATSPGDFYEGLNLASIHKLPLVVVVENNQFAYSTPIDKQTGGEGLGPRAGVQRLQRRRFRKRPVRRHPDREKGDRSRAERKGAGSHRVPHVPRPGPRRARRRLLRLR
jgi:TPP-dependent pyruvate/acetoin dehydrogenase alpha subunit